MTDEKALQTKDALTESDIKTIEDKVINKVVLQFNDLAKKISESPPKSADDLRNLSNELDSLFASLSGALGTMDNLNVIKRDL